LNVQQLARLLDGPQRTDDGIEERQQDEHAVLVHVELPITGSVATAPRVMEARQQWAKLREVLQPADILLLNFFPPLASLPQVLSKWQLETPFSRMRKFRAEYD
jgi:hypothetical protein